MGRNIKTMKNQLNLFDGIKSVFYNTNRTEKAELLKAGNDVKKQNDAILELFRTSFPKWTASLVWEQLISTGKIDPHTPLTSIRRGITQLKDSGFLEKETEVRIGLYGKNEHYYKLIQ